MSLSLFSCGNRGLGTAVSGLADVHLLMSSDHGPSHREAHRAALSKQRKYYIGFQVISTKYAIWLRDWCIFFLSSKETDMTGFLAPERNGCALTQAAHTARGARPLPVLRARALLGDTWPALPGAPHLLLSPAQAH